MLTMRTSFLSLVYYVNGGCMPIQSSLKSHITLSRCFPTAHSLLFLIYNLKICRFVVEKRTQWRKVFHSLEVVLVLVVSCHNKTRSHFDGNVTLFIVDTIHDIIMWCTLERSDLLPN